MCFEFLHLCLLSLPPFRPSPAWLTTAGQLGSGTRLPRIPRCSPEDSAAHLCSGGNSASSVLLAKKPPNLTLASTERPSGLTLPPPCPFLSTSCPPPGAFCAGPHSRSVLGALFPDPACYTRPSNLHSESMKPLQIRSPLAELTLYSSFLVPVTRQISIGEVAGEWLSHVVFATSSSGK